MKIKFAKRLVNIAITLVLSSYIFVFSSNGQLIIYHPNDPDPMVLLSRTNGKSSPHDAVENSVNFKIDQFNISRIKKKDNLALSVNIDGIVKVLGLEQIVPLGESLSIKTGKTDLKHKPPLFFKCIEDSDKNVISGLVLHEQSINFFYFDQYSNYQLSKLKNSNEYILYNSKNLKAQKPTQNCHEEILDDIHLTQPINTLKFQYKTRKTFNFLLEIDYPLYNNLGSLEGTLDYVYNLWLQEFLLFEREGLSAQLGGLIIWDQLQPYSNYENSSTLLQEFKSRNELNGFDYDVLHLLTSRDIGGGRAYVNGICKKVPFAVSGNLNGNVLPFPDYSWDLTVFSHENGHLFGLRHTHRCNWGNQGNDQIDDCGNFYITHNGLDDNGDGIVDNQEEAEGFQCYDPNNPIFPINGGSIMSYCHLINGSNPNEPNIQVNLANGFGNELRNILPQLATCGCDHPDYHQMMALYYNTNGEYWRNDFGWRKASQGKNCDPCTWYGVQCNNNRVVSIELSDNNLRGPIPYELSQLTQLKKLDLSNNLLEGCIPPSFDQLCTQIIKLGNNRSLSHEGNFENFCSNISADCECKSSEFLALQEIYQTMGGENWTNKDGWESESCDPCSWHGVTCNERNQVITLNLSNNKLVGELPSALLKLIFLQQIDMSNNSIIGEVPDNLSSYQHLRQIDLSNNELSGCIPRGLKALCGSIQLDLFGNEDLQEDFDDFCDLPNPICDCNHPDYDALMDFYFKLNGDDWVIKSGWGSNCDPCSWYGITCNTNNRVNKIFFLDQRMEGTLSPKIGELDELEDFFLRMRGSKIDVRGPLPASFGNLHRLTSLKISGTNISGSFPDELQSLTKLREVELYSNNFSGQVPGWFGTLPNLRHLNFSSNNFTGIFPAELAKSNSLTVLVLSNNNIEGCIPQNFLDKCEQIRFLGLALNPDISAPELTNSCDYISDFCSCQTTTIISTEFICENDSNFDALIENDTTIHCSRDGCDSLVITENVILPLTELDIEFEVLEPDCYGSKSGSIKVNSKDNRELTFTWSNGDLNQGVSSRIDSIYSGSHWLLTSNGDCVSDTFYFNIEEPHGIDPNNFIITNPVSCQPGIGGTFDSNLSNEQKEEYIFKWLHTDNGSYDLTDLKEGTYFLTIEDKQGCQINESFVIKNTESIKLILDDSQTTYDLCQENSTSIEVLAQPEDKLYEIYFNDEIADQVIQLVPGIHEIKIKDENGCKDSTTVEIRNRLPSITFDKLTLDKDCTSENIYILNQLNVNEDFELLINSFQHLFGDTIALSAGHHFIEVINSETQCMWDTSIHIQSIDTNYILPSEIIVTHNLLDTFSIQFNNQDNLSIVDWQLADYACLDQKCTQIQTSLSESQLVNILIKYNGGCLREETIDVKVITTSSSQNYFYIPNVISKESLINNELCIHHNGTVSETVNFQLFNRWGNAIIESSNINSGTEHCILNQSDIDDIPYGVYVYSVKFILLDGTTRSHYGDITIL